MGIVLSVSLFNIYRVNGHDVGILFKGGVAPSGIDIAVGDVMTVGRLSGNKL